jgi:4-amino-4-deoxy-L-arabinose transferase-like glycosyltransferase
MASWPSAFVGFYDAGGYVATAQGLTGSPVRPLGYPIFLRALHALSPQLAWTIAVQHLLGLATAAFLYLTARKITRSRLVALVPAAVVLFDGLLVVLEHTLMSETLFVFLVAMSSYAAVRSLDDGAPWAALSGAAAAAGAVTRPVGFLLIPVPVVALLLWRAGGFRVRARRAGLAAGAGVGVCLVYLLILAVAPGNPRMALSPSSGRVLYSRMAPFADCRSFDPPARTQRLCEGTPASDRPGTNYYLWSPHSPAWRAYGPPPAGDRALRSFAIAALTHQPGAYASGVAHDLRRYFMDWHLYVHLADDRIPYVLVSVRRYYRGLPPRDSDQAGPLLSYAGAVFADSSWPLLVLVVGPGLSLLVTRGRERHGTAILAATGWILLIGAVATANHDPRYAAVALGSLAAGSAPALGQAARQLATLGRTVPSGGAKRPGLR